MNVRVAIRLVTRTLTAVVMGVSATYLLVYLYRWEWNRALISGVFFVAAEVSVVTILLSARLSRLERRVEERASSAAPVDVESDADVERESPFAWLDPVGGQFGVFVPLLLGAGVILSAIAFAIEKLSGAVARTRAAERPVSPVGPLVPAGGLVGEPVTRLKPNPPGGAPGGRPAARTGALLALAGLAAFPAVGLLADATQTRPDPHPDRTTVELDVWVRDARQPATAEAAALRAACQGRARLDHVEVTAAAPGRARLVMTGVMGEHARRKFTGCLEDATLDGVQAAVVGISTTPADAALAG